MKLYDCEYYLHTPVKIHARTDNHRPVIIYFEKGEMEVEVGQPDEDHDTFNDMFEVFAAPVETDCKDNSDISLEKVKQICETIDVESILNKYDLRIKECHENWKKHFAIATRLETPYGPLFTLTVKGKIPWDTPYRNRVGLPDWEAAFADCYGRGLYLYFYQRPKDGKVKSCLFKALDSDEIKPLELTKVISEVFGGNRFGCGGEGRSEVTCAGNILTDELTGKAIDLLIEELKQIESAKD